MNGSAKTPGSEGSQSFVVDLPRRAFRRCRQRAPLPAGQPGPAELAERLRRFPLFAGLPPEQVSELASAASVAVFRTGDPVWRQGERNRWVMFIEQGLVKTARCRRGGGGERTYGLHGPGDSMGLHAIWAGMKYPTDAVALNDGMTAILVDSDFLMRFAEAHPELSEPLMIEIGHFTEAFIRKIDIVSAGTVPERLAVLMTQLVERYGIAGPADSARLPINLTLTHLSEIVDARSETVARALGKWKREGWFKVDEHGCHFTHLDALYALLPS